MPIESTETSFKLQDRTALITGPCNSLTQSLASKFTQLGANVALIDPSATGSTQGFEKSKRFTDQIMDQREINERYGRATTIPLDLSKPQSIAESVSRSAEAFGGIDIYVDAMMSFDTLSFRDPKTSTELDRFIDINLRSPLMITHGVLRFLEGRKRGRVIYLINDIARMGLQGYSLMGASRSGLSTFARTLSREVQDKNITVNCVAVGVTEELLLNQDDAPAGGTAKTNISMQEAQTKLQQKQPGAVMIEPEKIANLVAFLASPLGSGITGQTIAVSQGMSFL